VNPLTKDKRRKTMEWLISLLVFLIVLGLLYWAAHRIISAFGLPAPVGVLVDVILVIIAVFYLLRYLNARFL
jgi:predicted exporter